MNFIKRMFCKHEYKTVTNIHGDAINNFNARSMKKCAYCGKIKFSPYLDKECKEVNKFWN